MTCSELPPSAVDRAGLSVARDKATNTILATLYFLYQLKHRPNFTAAFAFRLGEQIEGYLQSGRCLTSLARGGAIPSAAHLRQPVVFNKEVPAELVDPQYLWRNGAGNAPAIRQMTRRQREEQACVPAPGMCAARRAQTGKTEERAEKPAGGGPAPDSALTAGQPNAPAAAEARGSDDGHSDCAPELSAGHPLLTEEQEELVYLRKLRKVHTKQIKAMTESNNTLQLMVQKLEETLEQPAQSAIRSTEDRATDEAAAFAPDHQSIGVRARRPTEEPQQRLFQRQVEDARAASQQSEERLQRSEAARQVLADEKVELEAQLMRLAEAHGKLEKTHGDTVVELDCTIRELSDCRETCEMLELELRERTETLDELLRQQPPPQLYPEPKTEPDRLAAGEGEGLWKRDTGYASNTYETDGADVEARLGTEQSWWQAAPSTGNRSASDDFEAEVAALRTQAERAIAEGSAFVGSDSSRPATDRRRAVRFKSECVVCDDGGSAVVRIALQRPAKSLRVLRLEERQGRYLTRQCKPWQSVFRGSTRRQTRYARDVPQRKRT